jgi:hypothetical protein
MNAKWKNKKMENETRMKIRHRRKSRIWRKMRMFEVEVNEE